MKVHDIGLRLHKNDAGEIGWEVIVGGGLGRTPMIGVTVRDFLPQHELIGYLEAIMRVYNRYGRRDNKYKARIKILVHELGADEFKRRSRPNIARRPHPTTEVDGARARAHRRLFRAARLREAAALVGRVRGREAQPSGIRALGARTISGPQASTAMPSSTSR